MRTRSLLTLILALVACLAVTAPAVALVDLAAVAASDVAVEEGAPLSQSGRDRFEDAAADLRAAGTPSKFVILDARPADPVAYARSLRQRLSFAGDVLVLSNQPRNLSIASSLPSGTVQAVYDARLPELRQDPVGGTISVASDLAARRGTGGSSSGSGAAPVAPADDGDESSSGGGVFLVILLVGIGAIILLVMFARRKAKARAAQAQVADARELDPLVDALAAQIADLDDDVQMAGTMTAAAREHYDVAVLSYGEARQVLEGPPAPTPEQVRAAGLTLEKGLRAARRTRAVLEGRPPEAADQEPLLEGMCAFDPKHGKATTTVTISTPSGDKAELPACARCADQMARGEEPQFREVEEHGQRMPYWQGRGMGMGGGGLGPVLGGALAGVILGGMLGGGQASGNEGGFGDGGGGFGGDFGGGGGDFGGGGGFGGGGDFGGGGGGDF
ncbi:MAG: hypothetical protein AB7V62_13585 [Thermoleophilia bacterium]